MYIRVELKIVILAKEKYRQRFLILLFSSSISKFLKTNYKTPQDELQNSSRRILKFLKTNFQTPQDELQISSRRILKLLKTDD